MALSSVKAAHRRIAQRSLLRNKDLDFLILTGCSCLITLLHHPTVNHLQGSNGSSNTRSAAPTANHNSGSSTSSNSLGNYNAVTPKRQNFSIEEEEA